MRRMLSLSRLCIVFGLVASMWPGSVTAQLAPTGNHYAGRASDTGHQPGVVNASGGYGASVPLELPAARGGMIVPLHIGFGARGVGAAGLGWDVPLSYVRRDLSFAGRRPAFAPTRHPRGVNRFSCRSRVKRTTWSARDRTGSRNTTLPRLSCASKTARGCSSMEKGTAISSLRHSALTGTGVWLLSSSDGPGRHDACSSSTRSPRRLSPAAAALSIDLVRIQYNTHPDTGCAKHEVGLVYGAAGPSPLSLSMLGDRVLARMRTLSAVEVKSRGSCGDPAERLRRYELTYLPDADTQQPRLRSVQMFGRQGSPEEHTSIVVASYAYGAASTAGKLMYQKTQTIALPVEVDSTQIASTVRDPTVNAPTCGLRYATWQSLTDVTGDGRPDLVFAKNATLWVARNHPGSGGSTTLGRGAGRCPALRQHLRERRLRDANRDLWSLRLRRRPSQLRRGLAAGHRRQRRRPHRHHRCRRRSRSMGRVPEHAWCGPVLRQVGTALVLDQPAASLPPAARPPAPPGAPAAGETVHRPGPRRRGMLDLERLDDPPGLPYPAAGDNGSCGSVPNQLLSTGPELTYTEWEVTDVNGDGYPDVVFNSSPVDLVSMGRRRTRLPRARRPTRNWCSKRSPARATPTTWRPFSMCAACRSTWGSTRSPRP